MRKPEVSRPDRSIGPFVALLVAAMLFVYYTGGSLQRTVASHFDASGAPNGFMPRATFVHISLLIVLLPPIFLVLVPRHVLRSPNARINVPNRDYWLAPERRAETVAIIAHQCTRFGEMLLVFLCYAHWLVIKANTSIPVNWPSGWFYAGFAVFLGFTAIWSMRLLSRFRIENR